MIPEGTWKARGCEAALGHTGGGKPQVGVDLIILEGPGAGSHITWYGYFTEASFDRTIESLQLCGWKGPDLADLRGIDANEVNVVIAHEPDNDGVIRCKANWINPLGGVVMKDRMDAGAAASFAQSMKGRILALGSGKRPTPATGGAPAGDDIPF
jgi:hypothetical protein